MTFSTGAEILHWREFAQRLKSECERMRRDPLISINDPDRSKLIAATNHYTAADGRAAGLALQLVTPG